MRSPAGVAAVLLVGIASVFWYAAVSATINGEPSTSPFRGFVVLMQPGLAASQDQAKVMASALSPGSPGTKPLVSYGVAVCGSQPFHGELLIGGNARLSNMSAFPALGTRTATLQSSFRKISDLKLRSEPSGNGLELGPVQAVRITMPSPVKCLSSFSDQQPFPSFTGTTQELAGQEAASVQRPWRMGWWTGPRTGESWPLIGNLPGVSAQDLGEFQFQAPSGLNGSWARVAPEYFSVSAGVLRPSESVDEALPQTSSDTVLGWKSTQPIQPTAVVTDTAAMNEWQNWLVASGVLLGIGGSLLASLFFDWARAGSNEGEGQSERQIPPGDSAARPERSANAKRVIVITALVAAAWAIGRGKR